jgi:osmotically-inducible protein OsmY
MKSMARTIALAFVFAFGITAESGDAQPQSQFPAASHQTGETQVAPKLQGASEELTPPEVEKLIQDNLGLEPAMASAAVSVTTNDQIVVLGGNVDTQSQHMLALRIARFYAGNRQVVDKIRIKQM